MKYVYLNLKNFRNLFVCKLPAGCNFSTEKSNLMYRSIKKIYAKLTHIEMLSFCFKLACVFCRYKKILYQKKGTTKTIKYKFRWSTPQLKLTKNYLNFTIYCLHWQENSRVTSFTKQFWFIFAILHKVFAHRGFLARHF